AGACPSFRQKSASTEEHDWGLRHDGEDSPRSGRRDLVRGHDEGRRPDARGRLVPPGEGGAGEGLEPGFLLGPGGRRLELEVEVRAGGLAGRADEPDLLARREARADHDIRVQDGEVTVRPALAVPRLEGEADAAARVGRRPGPQDDRVVDRVDRGAGRGGDVDRRVVVMGVRGGDDAGAAADRKHPAGVVRRAGEEVRHGGREGRRGRSALGSAEGVAGVGERGLRLRDCGLEQQLVGEEGRAGLAPLRRAQTRGRGDDGLARRVEALLEAVEGEGRRAVGLVEVGEREHLVDVPVGVVVGEDRAVQVAGGACGSEVARGGEDRVARGPRIGDAVPVRVQPPAHPRRGHELHPADGACRARAHVPAEVRLDLVDGREHLPGHAVLGAGLLPEREELGVRERCLGGGRVRSERHGERRRDDREGVRTGGRAAEEGDDEDGGEERGALHGYPAGTTRRPVSSCSGWCCTTCCGPGAGAVAAACSAASVARWTFSARSSSTRKSWRWVAALAATSRSIEPASTSWMSACVNVCMPKYSPSATASEISSARPSRMSSAMRAFITIASMAATRPPPTRGRSRWLTTPRRTPAMIARITCCFSGGKNSTMRPTVSAASIVCSVESTRWPDSAAWRAVWAVSASRSSPMRITSGSWRSARRSAWPKSVVSRPISRWFTMQPWSGWRISIGSSIVMMCFDRVLFMWSIIAARVVVFPEPVAPVTRMRPRCSSARVCTTGGMPSCSSVGTFFGMTRKAKLVAPRWRYALTRKRGRSSSWYAMSRSPLVAKAARRSGERAPTVSRTRARSASLSGAVSSAARPPSRRRTGGRPSLRWMSLAPSSTARLSRPFRSTGERSALRAGGFSDSVDRADGDLLETPRVAGGSDLAPEDSLDRAPRHRKPGEGEGRARETVEGALRAPAGVCERDDAVFDGDGIRRQVAGQHGLGGEHPAVESLVHPVARERVDEPGGVPDRQRVAAHERRAGAAHRQSVAARGGRRFRVDAVGLAHATEVHSQARAFARPAAYADVDVVALGEDPAVATWDGRDLEHHRARVAHVVREVRLERDTVHDFGGEAELLRACPVAAVGADDDVRVYFPCVERGAFAHLRAPFGRAFEQEVVEPLALRHVRERRARAALETGAEVEAAFDAVDHVLDDGLDREGKKARSAHGDAAAAGLVAREARLVEQEHARARAREAIGAGRACGAGADDGDVVGCHDARLQSAPRGCARAAKGNGL